MAEKRVRRTGLSTCVSASLVILVALSGCEATPKSGRCAAVDTDHLARKTNVTGLRLICDPRRVAAPYRDQYFPGYEWGDEKWWDDTP